MKTAGQRRHAPATGPLVLAHARVETPIGPLALLARGEALCGVSFGALHEELRRWLERRFGPFTTREALDPAGAASGLRAYFQGDMAALDLIAVDTGGTPFQQQVWAELRRIPAGRTLSYSELAACLGNPRGLRAVGLANGRNPVPVVVPCHRVIASDGTLWGYGGGLERKRWLLRHEGAAFAESRRTAQGSLAFEE